MELFLKNCKILKGKRLTDCSMLLYNGKIAKIFPKNTTVNVKTIDLKGKIVLPGIIDPHVHLRDPGFTHKEDFRTGTRAAIKGGITTIIDMPNTKPQTITTRALQEKRKIASSKACCNYGFHFGALKPAEINKAKNIPAIKAYMDITTGKMIQKDTRTLLRSFSSVPVVAVHAEEDTLLKAGELTAAAGNILYVCHVSSEKDLQIIRKLRRKLGRKRVLAEVAPHHLYMSESDARTKKGFAIMKPGLKTKKDQAALWKALKKGEIDTIGTDHAPHTLTEKRSKDPPYGVPGLETSLCLMLDAVNKKKIELWRVQKLMCENPAEIFKIWNKGCIKEGCDADLVVIDINKKMKISNKNIVSKCKWTPFDGMTAKGWPVMTILHGKIAYNQKFYPSKGNEILINR